VSILFIGWFDAPRFLQWLKVWEKQTRWLEGKRVLVGDNMKTHHSVAAIDFCKEHGIEYVCFPPNSTDKLQPLDVGVYRSVKEQWRQLLRRMGQQDPSLKVMDKSVFPSMLRELMEHLDHKPLLENAFAKCGLHPLDPERPLQNIPDILSSHEIASNLDQQLLKKLEVRRFGTQKTARGPKVPPGKSYCAESSSEEEEHDKEREEEEEIISSSGEDEVSSSSSSEEEEEENADSILQSLEEEENVESMEQEEESDDQDEHRLLKTGILVAVNYEVSVSRVLPFFCCFSKLGSQNLFEKVASVFTNNF